MEREACVCDHGFERSDLCAEIIIIIITVYPMLSASGNLFKCHEEVLFYFFTCCIGIPT